MCFFSWQGSVPLQKNDAVIALHAKFKRVGDLSAELLDGEDAVSAVLQLDGGDHCSFATTEGVIDWLLEFGRYTTAAARVITHIDDTETEVFVGSPEQVTALQSVLHMEAAVDAIKKLSFDEVQRLSRFMVTPEFWSA